MTHAVTEGMYCLPEPTVSQANNSTPIKLHLAKWLIAIRSTLTNTVP
jgi:hypothetical protein